MGNSSSTPSSSTTTNGEQYDVFISFRGEDTRKGFTSHLYQALQEKQIKTFIDNQLKRGEEISEGLLSVIRESKISVVIFSENYASSKWCLRELAEIMKCWEMKKQIVKPVFYEVDPSHVRNHSGSYEAAFAKHENGLQQEEVKKWREALTQASNISGFDSSVARNEAEFVCDIVIDVWNNLYNISPSCDFKGLVGIEKHIERLESLLCHEAPDFRIIGIWGMGGIGKTTIAKAVFQQVSHRFENRTYFTPSVRAESKNNHNGLIHLRDEILSKVLIIENQISGSPDIHQRIRRMLKQKKVLIVLDDVNKVTEWETLAEGLDADGLAPGSRIILTARDTQVLRNCGVADHNMYKVEELNCDETLQLFCKYAFKQNHPTKDFEVLSRVVVKIATNLPLAVKVLGSLLYTKSKRDWENAVDKFQRNVNPEVLDVLKISYDGLDEEEKGLFLDIACFVEFEFKIDEVHFAPNLLSDREFSLNGLIDKSLVTVEDHRIKMHDLLREMGKEIVSKNRSRLWRQEDVLRTLKHNDGTDAIQGIFLNMYKLRDVHLSSQALREMYNLKTLIINYEHLHQASFCDLPHELRYLHWTWGYPLEVLPSSFNPVNLVELDLSCNKIMQLWEGKKCVPKLKRLKLTHCFNLIRIPDLSDIPSVESINLECCVSLLEIHSSTECPKLKWLNLSCCQNLIWFLDLSDIPSVESINLNSCISLLEIHSSRECPKLKQLDLSCCENLIRIPDLSDIPSAESINLTCRRSLLEFHSSRECPKNLNSLQLWGCEHLSRLPSNIHIEGSEFRLRDFISLTKIPHISGNIRWLDLSGSGVEEVPSTIRSLSKLKRLDMRNCTSLKCISKSICKLKSLEELDLRGCWKLESFPDILERMELKYLDLSGTGIKELPPSIGNLNRLEILVLSDCEYLETFPSSISNLPPLLGLCSLKILELNNCNLTEISEDIGCLSSLQLLDLHGNSNFERLPKSIKQFSKLYRLKLCKCGMLRSLPELPSSLIYLEAMNCKQLIQSFLDESEFELFPDNGRPLYLNFMNCLKLNQKAVSNLFQESLLKMQLMGTENIISLFKVCPPFFPPPLRLLQTPHEVKADICLPGSEIPEWFCYKNNGSSINIPGLRNDCGRNRYIMGFAVCLVIGFEDNIDIGTLECIDVLCYFHIEISDGHKKGFFHRFPMFDMRIEDNVFIDSDHILLGYNLSSKCYEFFQKLDTLLANHSMSGYVGTSFRFNCVHDCHKVKHCGINPIYVRTQVMNSVAINQDTEDTSGCNDTAEETCEPHPTRICIEANQCS